MSVAMATRMAAYRLFGAGAAPPSHRHRRCAGGGGGRGAAHAAAGSGRAPRRRGASLLQRGADREGRGLPHRPAVAVRRADGDRAGRARRSSCAGRRACCCGRAGARCWPARRPPRRCRSRSPLATLPVRAIARERAKDVGLVTQDWVGYAGDVAKSTAIGAVLAGAGGALLVFGMRRFGRRWWAPGGRRGGRLRRRHDLPDADRARPAVQQVHAAARRPDALDRARRWRARRASTSARST